MEGRDLFSIHGISDFASPTRFIEQYNRKIGITIIKEYYFAEIVWDCFNHEAENERFQSQITLRKKSRGRQSK